VLKKLDESFWRGLTAVDEIKLVLGW
jgi:hypothetical protein